MLFFTAAKEALDGIEIIEANQLESEMLNVEQFSDQNKQQKSSSSKKYGVTDECRGCLSSVGMAVWNCGTFEMDCIKGAIGMYQ